MTTVSKPVFFEVSYKWRSCYTGKLTKSSKESILRSPQRWLVSLLLPSWCRPLSLPSFFSNFQTEEWLLLRLLEATSFFRVFFKEREKENKNEIDYIVSLNLCWIFRQIVVHTSRTEWFPNFIISITQNSLEIGLYTGCPINSTKPRYTPHGYTITDSSLP